VVEMNENEMKDSFTIGTAGKDGCIKVYFDSTNAEEKINLALKLYNKYVELKQMRREL
jgi:hypothetical protein